MSVTWSEAPTGVNLRLRLMTWGLAGLICTALVYSALTKRFGVIADLFPEGAVIDTVVDISVEPPPPPPIARPEEPPPEIQQTIVNPDAPPTPYYDAVQLTPLAPPSPFITNATFLERPSGRDFERYFPARALARGQSGRVVLDCTVAADGRVGCVVASEEPAGWGFGEASLRAARHFRVAPASADGTPTSGGRLRVPMAWRAQ